jgi:hypothetical protein
MKTERPKLGRMGLTSRTVFCLLAIGLVILAASHYVRRSRLATTYTKVQMGDSKQTLVQVIGDPNEIAMCQDPNSNVDKSQKCAETYWYYSFLERWGFALNADGKVIDKIYNVSY